ncbi:carboxypeptidase-like regulatory domain-containing protein [Bremerella alba]|uniref:Carboxypeptidase regulatory-like domain-containing protein n=1 Tax=Bremerella alba TaxID=980252 RepID=A0A7V9A7G8_9BACT|nr:carboxypeptidase-like regulatory domain-containing protein [Bremerella alba]MBA2115352.1 hypothetical protein [Bremerella alba]
MRLAACLCVFMLVWTSSVSAQTRPDEKLATIVGKVIDQDGNGVESVAVTVQGYDHSAHATTDQEGQFRCEFEERKLRIARILADDQQADRLGIFTVAYRDPPTADKPITITVEPLAGVTVSRYRPVYRDGSQRFTPAWGDSTTTNEQGKFTLTDLVVGQKYFLSCRDEEQEVHYQGLPNYIPVESGTHDLGEIKVTPSR